MDFFIGKKSLYEDIQFITNNFTVNAKLSANKINKNIHMSDKVNILVSVSKYKSRGSAIYSIKELEDYVNALKILYSKNPELLELKTLKNRLKREFGSNGTFETLKL